MLNEVHCDHQGGNFPPRPQPSTQKAPFFMQFSDRESWELYACVGDTSREAGEDHRCHDYPAPELQNADTVAI